MVPGYSAVRHDQPPNPGGRGGGLLTYVKADIPFRQIPAYRGEEVAGGLEALAVEIQRGARGKFAVTNLYMPPIELRFWVCWLPFEHILRDKKSTEWHPFHDVQETHLIHMRLKDLD
jgi:hypothetical protein